MPYKDPEKSRAAIRKHYQKNKAYYYEKANRKRRELREYIQAVKAANPCADCGINYPYFVMDFDHVEQNIKKVDIISRLVKSNSAKKLHEEIKKCEVVCANCHRIRTYKRVKSK